MNINTKPTPNNQILINQLFSPSSATTPALFTIGSAQLTRILSTVAGLCNLNNPSSPHCFLAALSASRIAKKTALPKNKGGSPTPLDR